MNIQCRHYPARPNPATALVSRLVALCCLFARFLCAPVAAEHEVNLVPTLFAYNTSGANVSFNIFGIEQI
jgi:hypothetical protein